MLILNNKGESTHLEQAPQVNGQLAETPTNLHLPLVNFAATHLQFLTILFPFFFFMKSLSGESLQFEDTAGAGVKGVTTGADVRGVGDVGDFVRKDGDGAGVVIAIGDGGVPQEHFPSSGISRGEHCIPPTQGSQLLIPLELHESVHGLLNRPLKGAMIER